MLSLSALFEYLCMWSTAIVNILLFSIRGQTNFTRQNLALIDVRFRRLLSVPALKVSI